MAKVADFLSEWRNPKPYVIARTSGSTGEPKAIRLLKSDMRVSAMATNEFFGISSESVLALPLSVDYIAGKMMAVRAQVAGCRLLELPVSGQFSVMEPTDLISIVPNQLPAIYEQRPGYIKAVLIGGAPLTATQEREIVSKGINAWLGYGMTETCSHVAIRRVGADGIFHAMPGISFAIDERGCLVIRSERFSWRELATNDIAELGADATSFRWLGRADNVVNSGGIKLHPEILEEMYRDICPQLPPFCLIGEPDESLGQRLVMVVETEEDIATMQQLLRERITDHRLLPKRVVGVKLLPRTPNGKIRRGNWEV